MKKEKPKKKYLGLIIMLIILIILASIVGLAYWKIKRISQSIFNSAQKANSQNTPLTD